MSKIPLRLEITREEEFKHDRTGISAVGFLEIFALYPKSIGLLSKLKEIINRKKEIGKIAIELKSFNRAIFDDDYVKDGWIIIKDTIENNRVLHRIEYSIAEGEIPDLIPYYHVSSGDVFAGLTIRNPYKKDLSIEEMVIEIDETTAIVCNKMNNDDIEIRDNMGIIKEKFVLKPGQEKNIFLCIDPRSNSIDINVRLVANTSYPISGMFIGRCVGPHRTLLEANIREKSHIYIEEGFSINIDEDIPYITTFEMAINEPWKIQHIIRALIENMGYVITLEDVRESVREGNCKMDRYVFHARSMDGVCRIQMDVEVNTELKHSGDDLENNIEKSRFVVRMKIWAETMRDGQRIARDIEQNLYRRIEKADSQIP